MNFIHLLPTVDDLSDFVGGEIPVLKVSEVPKFGEFSEDEFCARFIKASATSPGKSKSLWITRISITFFSYSCSLVFAPVLSCQMKLGESGQRVRGDQLCHILQPQNVFTGVRLGVGEGQVEPFDAEAQGFD